MPAAHLGARTVVDRSGHYGKRSPWAPLQRSLKAAKNAKISKIAKGEGDFGFRYRAAARIAILANIGRTRDCTVRGRSRRTLRMASVLKREPQKLLTEISGASRAAGTR